MYTKEHCWICEWLKKGKIPSKYHCRDCGKGFCEQHGRFANVGFCLGHDKNFRDEEKRLYDGGE